MTESQQELGYIVKPNSDKRVPIRDYGKELREEKARQKYLKEALKSLKADIKS